MAPRFLFVEDDRVVTRALKRNLEPFGEAAFAYTKHEAIETLRASTNWNALILDVALPDGSGLDVLEYARTRRCTCPALILTGSQERTHLNRAFDLGARYLVKPCDIARLKRFVREAITRSSHVETYATLWASRYMLTGMETMLLVAAAEGTPQTDIADERGIAPGTMKRHVHNLLQKTGDPSLLAAATRLLRERLGETATRSSSQ